MKIVLLFSRISDLNTKTAYLVEEAQRVCLKLNAKKCKTLRTKCAKRDEKVLLNGEEVEDVKEFIYLVATVDKEGGGNRDIAYRLQKARGALRRLKRIWTARGIGRTKLKLFNSLVQPILLYGCETWKMTV